MYSPCLFGFSLGSTTSQKYVSRWIGEPVSVCEIMRCHLIDFIVLKIHEDFHQDKVISEDDGINKFMIWDICSESL